MASNFKLDRNFEAKLRKAVAPQLKERAGEMEKVLSGLTEKHKGETPEAIKPLLLAAFKREGWKISDPELSRFAGAISDGTSINVRAN